MFALAGETVTVVNTGARGSIVNAAEPCTVPDDAVTVISTGVSGHAGKFVLTNPFATVASFVLLTPHVSGTLTAPPRVSVTTAEKFWDVPVVTLAVAGLMTMLAIVATVNVAVFDTFGVEPFVGAALAVMVPVARAVQLLLLIFVQLDHVTVQLCAESGQPGVLSLHCGVAVNVAVCPKSTVVFEGVTDNDRK